MSDIDGRSGIKKWIVGMKRGGKSFVMEIKGGGHAEAEREKAQESLSAVNSRFAFGFKSRGAKSPRS